MTPVKDPAIDHEYQSIFQHPSISAVQRDSEGKDVHHVHCSSGTKHRSLVPVSLVSAKNPRLAVSYAALTTRMICLQRSLVLPDFGPPSVSVLIIRFQQSTVS
jgi:hypothetical protein